MLINFLGLLQQQVAEELEKKLLAKIENITTIDERTAAFIFCTNRKLLASINKLNLVYEINGSQIYATEEYYLIYLKELKTLDKLLLLIPSLSPLPLVKWIVTYLFEHHQKMTAVESLTAGLVQATLAEVSGVSSVFPGGYVTYSAQAKEKLGVPAEIIDNDGVVSCNCAKEMAVAAKKEMIVDYALSLTGVAGPEELEGHKPGTVYIGMANKDEARAYLFNFIGSRNKIRKQSVMTAFCVLYHQFST